MPTVISGYSRFSPLDADSRLSSRGLIFYRGSDESDRVSSKTNSTLSGDNVSLSRRGLVMAAKPRPREELEELDYEPLLTLNLEDGGTITVSQAGRDADGQTTGAALKVAAVRADGAEEVIYIDALPRMEAEQQTEAGTASAGTGMPENRDGPGGESPEATVLRTIIDLYGLEKTDNDSNGILDSLFTRIQAMIEAAEEAGAGRDALETLNADSAAEHAEQTGKENAASAVAETDSTPSGKVTGYTSRGMAAFRGEYSPARFNRNL